MVDFLRNSHCSRQQRLLQLKGMQSQTEVTVLGPWMSFMGLWKAGSSSLEEPEYGKREGKRKILILVLEGPFLMILDVVGCEKERECTSQVFMLITA